MVQYRHQLLAVSQQLVQLSYELLVNPFRGVLRLKAVALVVVDLPHEGTHEGVVQVDAVATQGHPFHPEVHRKIVLNVKVQGGLGVIEDFETSDCAEGLDVELDA